MKKFLQEPSFEGGNAEKGCMEYGVFLIDAFESKLTFDCLGI